MALCIVINFLVLWSICLSLVDFKNSPQYFNKVTTFDEISSAESIIKKFFSFYWSTLFLFFPCLMVSTSSIAKCLLLSFSSSILILLKFSSSTPSFVFYHFSFVGWYAFLMPNSISLSLLYILIVCIRVSIFSFFAVALVYLVINLVIL